MQGSTPHSDESTPVEAPARDRYDARDDDDAAGPARDLESELDAAAAEADAWPAPPVAPAASPRNARMHRPRRWTLADPTPAEAEELATRLKTSAVLAQVLLNRGLRAAEECQSFLRPSLRCLHDPASIPNLSKAADRVARAIREGQKVVIYGDYDVDGITATAILWHAIKLLGGNVDYYIPHRIDEGYGLNCDAIAEICDAGASLILTVDCGVTAVEPARVARERGVDLIITDHHEWHEGIADCPLPIADLEDGSTPPQSAMGNRQSAIFPDCYTIVHPRLPHPDGGTAYPNPYLCGAGVAFKLAWGIGQAVNGTTRVNEEFKAYLLEATALAALGTIADVVPLVGENRILAAYGLGGLKQSKLVGIKALIASANLTGQKLDSYHVGFLLAPRLNACGRMGHAREAVEMLTKADEATANRIALELENRNTERRAIEKKIVEQAVQQVQDQGLDTDDCRAIVVAGEGWHPGVIGIVASRLVDRFHKPAIVIAMNEGVGSGSGRSIAGFPLSKALDACSAHLETHGGHEMAAGLKVTAEKLPAFRAAFMAHAKGILCPEQLVPELKLDAAAELRHLTEALVNDIKRLGPFGHGNRRPLFLCRGLELAGPLRRVGANGDHVQLFLRQGPHTMKAIAFNYGQYVELCERLRPGTVIDLAFEPTINEFNGRTNVELQVKDLQLV